MIFKLMSGSDDCEKDLVRFDCGPSFWQATLLERGSRNKTLKVLRTLDTKFVLLFSSFRRIIILGTSVPLYSLPVYC